MSIPSIIILHPARKRGRPAQFGERATRRFEFVATTSQFHDLESVAKDEQKTVSALIRDAVDEYVGDYRERRVFTARPKRR